ncbi:MAG: thiamine-phosphate kinase [Syntrophobacteria bacterium]
MRLKEIGEFGFIERIRDGCLVRSQDVVKHIGDDCFVFKGSRDMVMLFTTDILVEGVHFLSRATAPYQLGRKSLAVNLSDIAAMGGIPKEALISIAVPETVEVEYLDSVYNGMKSMAREFDVNLAGGDTSSSPDYLVINVALVGEAPEEEVLYRSGARVGDVVFLTGPVGSSAAGLHIILSDVFFQGQDELLHAHNDPVPHVKGGRIIASLKAAHSLIDVSDGVVADLGHICNESRVGAVIEEESIPTTARFREYCEQFGLDFRHLALQVGEDYVLLGTVPRKSSGKVEQALISNGCAFFPIGETVSGAGVKLRCGDGSLQEVERGGWNHFGANRFRESARGTRGTR